MQEDNDEESFFISWIRSGHQWCHHPVQLSSVFMYFLQGQNSGLIVTLQSILLKNKPKAIKKPLNSVFFLNNFYLSF